MADVQLENGFLKIANSLFEAIYRHGFTQRELTILLCIVRWTYGFDRKSTEMSLRFIEKDTGIAYQHISRTLINLESDNVIVISKAQGRTAQQISIQKDYEKWSNSNQKGYSNQKSDSNQIGDTNSHQKSDTNSNQFGDKDNTSIKKQELKTRDIGSEKSFWDDFEHSESADAEPAAPGTPTSYAEPVKAKAKKKSANLSLPDARKMASEFTDNEKLRDMLIEFYSMRKDSIKKPMTARAFTMMLNKLSKLSDDANVQSLILEQSIFHCWQDVYALKEDYANHVEQSSEESGGKKWQK